MEGLVLNVLEISGMEALLFFFKEHVGSFFLGLELCSVLLVGLWLGD